MVAKISIFFGDCLKFLIFFLVNGKYWARAYVCRKNESTTPPGTMSPVMLLKHYASGMHNIRILLKILDFHFLQKE